MKYPRYTLRIFNKKGKEIHLYHTRRKRSLLARADLYYKRGFRIYIKALYKPPDYQNEGEYYTKKDFLYAYKCFTEENLIKDFV